MTSRHAGPTTSGALVPVPEPSYAERARTLVHLGQAGALATVSRRHPGHPFASVMPYALDAAGQPLFLISSMAMHTQNLEADPRASMLVTQRTGNDDVLAAGRVTLMGQTHRLEATEVAAARAAYLDRHQKARFWVDFDDFAFWRLDLTEVYFVGGFAAMDWVSVDAYLGAAPDPLAEVASSILDHMNQDHAGALLVYARAFAGTPADEATMTSVDRLGFTLRLRTGERLHGVRIAFPREVRSAGDARVVLVEMLREARGQVRGGESRSVPGPPGRSERGGDGG